MSQPRPRAQNLPGSNIKRAAVAIRRSDFGLHTGLLFRGRKGVEFLHLEWHRRLSCDAADGDGGLHWCEPNLSNNAARYFSILAEEISRAENGTEIPYALDRAEGRFNPVTYKFEPGPIGTGLTCASFVWLVFETGGIKLFNFDGWTNDAEDENFFSRIIAALEKQFGAEDPQVIAMKARPKSPRIRPADLIAAAAIPKEQWPLRWAVVRELGSTLLKEAGLSQSN